MENIHWRGMSSQRIPAAAQMHRADPAVAQRFREALNPQGHPCNKPPAATGGSADGKVTKTTATAAADSTEATDAEMAQLPARELAGLKEKWGEDVHGFKVDAKSLFQIRESILQAPIFKAMSKSMMEMNISG